jgi:hypothetical protein
LLLVQQVRLCGLVETMRITVLTHLEREKAKVREVVVEQVRAALKKTGHTVSVLGIHGDVRKLITGISRRQPDLLFNLIPAFTESPSMRIALCACATMAGSICAYRIRERFT